MRHFHYENWTDTDYIPGVAGYQGSPAIVSFMSADVERWVTRPGSLRKAKLVCAAGSNGLAVMRINCGGNGMIRPPLVERDWNAMPEVMFAGPDGRLEGRYHHSKEPNAPLALILHPHPLHGGTMNNRIAYAMYQSFQKLGCSVMRFNFRGVGRSQGKYDGGFGEISDAAAALDWMQMVNPNSGGLWISGYSFGAFVGMQLLMRRPEISGWVSVAPPANHYDFGFLAPCPCGGLMMHGDNDELVPEPAVRKLVDKLNTQKNVQVDYRVCAGADHVFASHADTVADAIEDYVGTIIARKAMALAAD